MTVSSASKTPTTANSRWRERKKEPPVAGGLMRWGWRAASIEAAAAGREQSGGPPLQEQDDRQQHEDLSQHGIKEDLLERLVGQADAQRAHHGAKDAADAAHDHGHETVDNVLLP